MQHTISSKTLLKASLASFVVAAIAIVTLILPAEYNLDPTGIGQSLGLTILAQPAPAEEQVSVKHSGTQQEIIEVIVPAGRGVEYKFMMAQFTKLTYEWFTDGAPLYFDLHGEPEDDTTGYFESYAIATLEGMKGSFTTPFTGSHGWYWKNQTDMPAKIQLIVSGEYESHMLKQ